MKTAKQKLQHLGNLLLCLFLFSLFLPVGAALIYSAWETGRMVAEIIGAAMVALSWFGLREFWNEL